jgi:orotate phosphoribosyltransferase
MNNNLFQLGDFTLASGAKSKWKLECDALETLDWQALAQMIHQMVPEFSAVVGVPQGGLKLAEALKPLVTQSGPLLIVDDVLTTGGSILKLVNEIKPPKWVAAVVFARGQCPLVVKAIFQMPESLWIKK